MLNFAIGLTVCVVEVALAHIHSAIIAIVPEVNGIVVAEIIEVFLGEDEIVDVDAVAVVEAAAAADRVVIVV